MTDRIWLPLFTPEQNRARYESMRTLGDIHNSWCGDEERYLWVRHNAVGKTEMINSGIFFDDPNDAFAYRIRWH